MKWKPTAARDTDKEKTATETDQNELKTSCLLLLETFPTPYRMIVISFAPLFLLSRCTNEFFELEKADQTLAIIVNRDHE